jgi:hypothetical protein
MNNWVNILRERCLQNGAIKESEILLHIPSNLQEEWDNFMRGKTCPLLENGDHGVYSWDLTQFLNRF